MDSFDPVLTNMITSPGKEVLEESRQVFDKKVRDFVRELEAYHNRLHIRQVIQDYFREPQTRIASNLDDLIPRIVSYYAYRSNYAGFDRILEDRYGIYLLNTLSRVVTEKTGLDFSIDTRR